MKKTVLVVEDDVSTRDMLRILLENLEYSVSEASDAEVAKSLLDQSSYDLIISDVRMPVSNGLNLLSHVRQTQKTDFILMGGMISDLEKSKAARLDVNGVLEKPFHPMDLLRLLENCQPRFEIV